MAGVRLLIQFTAPSAEIAEQQVEEMAGRCRQAQQEPGCIQFEVCRSALRPEHYILVEHWASQEALDAHQRAMGPRAPRPGITTSRERYEQQSS